MTEMGLPFAPLAEVPTGVSEYLSISSGEYFELLERVAIAQGLFSSTESALRRIVAVVTSKGRAGSKLNAITQVCLDNTGLARLGMLLLDDIESYLRGADEASQEDREAFLDALLGDETGGE